jgi:hypothetical protein
MFQADSKQTSAPIARVHAYDATNDNPLRFPWVLMDFVSGSTVKTKWCTMTDEKKIKLVKDLAGFLSQVHAIRFDAIGSLYQNEVATGLEAKAFSKALFLLIAIFVLGWWLVIALMSFVIIVIKQVRLSAAATGSPFYLGPVISIDMLRSTGQTHRGPYTTEYDWFCSRLVASQRRRRALLAEALREASEDSIDEAYNHRQILSWTDDLLGILPYHCDPNSAPSTYHLHVRDLHHANIMC